MKPISFRISIRVAEIPPDTDPILDLLPLLESAGYRLTENGIGGDERFLGFVAA